MKIIGFSGRAGSGKNTAAEALIRDYGAYPAAFADELKRIARRVWGLSETQTDGHLKEVVDERWGLTPRQIMQRLGTEVGRAVHPDTWVRYLLDRRLARDLFPPAMLAVITDVRFPNECEAIRNLGGIVIRIERPGLAGDDSHASEKAINLLVVDHVVVNDGTIADLHRKVLEVARPWVDRG